MCKFFSFVTEPENNGGRRFYFNWHYRKEHLQDENDSHSLICKHFKLKEDVCNKYEFNPLTKAFNVDQINNPIDDRIQVEDWVNKLDFKRVIEPLTIKQIVNPLNLPKATETPKDITDLKLWASVRASVWDSVRDSVGDSVRASVGDFVRASVGDFVGASVWDSVRASVGDSVRDSVGDSVRDSVGDSVRASVGDFVRASVGASVGASVWDSVRVYVSSFFDIKYKYDFSPCVQLWQSGLVPSFDGTTWRLHSGKKMDILFEITADELGKLEDECQP